MEGLSNGSTFKGRPLVISKFSHLNSCSSFILLQLRRIIKIDLVLHLQVDGKLFPRIFHTEFKLWVAGFNRLCLDVAATTTTTAIRLGAVCPQEVRVSRSLALLKSLYDVPNEWEVLVRTI